LYGTLDADEPLPSARGLRDHFGYGSLETFTKFLNDFKGQRAKLEKLELSTRDLDRMKQLWLAMQEGATEDFKGRLAERLETGLTDIARDSVARGLSQAIEEGILSQIDVLQKKNTELDAINKGLMAMQSQLVQENQVLKERAANLQEMAVNQKRMLKNQERIIGLLEKGSSKSVVAKRKA